MYNFLLYVFVLFASFLQTTVLASPKESITFALPPQNGLCVFASGDFVFENRMKAIAPSAKLSGVGTLADIHPHPTCGQQQLWGAIYDISNDDQEKVVKFAYEERHTITDVTVVKKDSDPVSCVSVDAGLLPHANPLAMYVQFSETISVYYEENMRQLGVPESEVKQEITVKDYLNKLTQIGVPADYVSWLGTLPAYNKDSPAPAYAASTSFYAPPMQDCPPPFSNGIGPQIGPYDAPENQVCVFVGGELIFEKAMKAVAPSATLIGAAMLQDEYIGLGCPTKRDGFVKYAGFDNVWGVAYTIDKADLDKFTKLGEQYRFTANVGIRVKELQETTCKTNDVGLLPSGFPFQIFKDHGKLDFDAYTKRLREVGVPSGHVDDLIKFKDQLQLYAEAAKMPPAHTCEISQN